MVEVPEHTLEVITAPERLGALRDEWRALDAVVAHPTIFLTWEWMEAWLHAVEWKRRLHVVVLRETAGTVVAIAPFMIGARGQLDRGRSVLSFVGSDGPQGGTYLDLLARPGWEGAAHLAVLKHLAATRHLYSYIVLNRVAVDAPGFTHWMAAALECELHATVDLRRRTVWMPLPATYPEFIASVSNPRWRQRIRNFPAALMKEHPSAQYVDRSQEKTIDAVLEDLRRLQAMRFGETSNYFQRDGFTAYMKRVCGNMQEQGRLQVHCLTIDGRVVSMRLGLVHRGTWIDFQVGSDPAYMKSNVAHLMLWHCVERAIAQQVRTMDSLDEYDYKKRYFAMTRQVADIRLYDRRLRSSGRLIMRAAYNSARSTLKSLVPEAALRWRRGR